MRATLATRFQNLVPTFVPGDSTQARPHISEAEALQYRRTESCPNPTAAARKPSLTLGTLEPLHPIGRYKREGTGVQMDGQDKQTVAAIDKIMSRLRAVVDQLASDERRQVLSSIRAISGEIADRLEAPSSRTH
jgi:hypothetical protein